MTIQKSNMIGIRSSIEIVKTGSYIFSLVVDYVDSKLLDSLIDYVRDLIPRLGNLNIPMITIYNALVNFRKEV